MSHCERWRYSPLSLCHLATPTHSHFLFLSHLPNKCVIILVRLVSGFTLLWLCKCYSQLSHVVFYDHLFFLVQLCVFHGVIIIFYCSLAAWLSVYLSFSMYLISQFIYSCLNLLVCPHPPGINLILVMSLLESLFRPQLPSWNWLCHPFPSSLAFRSSLLDPIYSAFLVNACILVEHILQRLPEEQGTGGPFLMSCISDHVLQGLANYGPHITCGLPKS